jgi:hypothetical protein
MSFRFTRFHRFRPRVPRLMDAELPTSLKRQLRYQAIASIVDATEFYPVFLQPVDERGQVITYQVEFMHVILSRMNRNLRRASRRSTFSA